MSEQDDTVMMTDEDVTIDQAAQIKQLQAQLECERREVESFMAVVDDLEQKLAAAERERDEAVAKRDEAIDAYQEMDDLRAQCQAETRQAEASIAALREKAKLLEEADDILDRIDAYPEDWSPAFAESVADWRTRYDAIQ